jgi:branched-chain amino acid transport system ATP-binding protein
MTTLLEVDGLCRSFGGLVVASNISLSLAGGDRVALIGPNGAGKTTFVNLVTGALRPSAGRLVLAGEEITCLREADRVRRGLVRTFQVTRLFRDMSTREHVALAILQRERQTSRMLRNLWRLANVEAETAEILEALGLSAIASEPVGAIAYGQQRLIELAIAVALRPRVLLLDEPAAGVPRGETSRILHALDRLPSDVAVLMIEHDVDLVFQFAARVVVLAGGTIISQGPPAHVAADARVREAYLGSYAYDRRGP